MVEVAGLLMNEDIEIDDMNIRLDKNNYQQGEQIYISGIRYSETTMDANVKVNLMSNNKIQSSTVLQFNPIFNRWEGSLWASSSGENEFFVEYKDQTGIYEQSGNFIVEESQIELNNLFLNELLLTNISNKTNGKYYPVSISEIGGSIKATYGNKTFELESNWRPGNNLFCGKIDNDCVVVQLAVRGTNIWMSWRGTSTTVTVRSERAAELSHKIPEKERADLSRFLLSPMPGLVVSISINAGDQVRAGQPLALVDAMKMENVLRAERDAIVSEIKVSEGDSVAVDQIIMEFC